MYQNFYTKCNSYNSEELKVAISNILNPLATQLGSFKDKSIMIKPNFLSANNLLASTTPETLEVVVDFFRKKLDFLIDGGKYE